MATADELTRLDATAQAELVRSRQVKPIELVDAAIARIERLNPRLNAVVARLDASARRAAQTELGGPFAGVPFLLKDLLAEHAGAPLAGSSRFLAGRYTSEHDSELVARYRRAGLIVVRSEEHTSELQSLRHLVCRLLLEKKKIEYRHY